MLARHTAGGETERLADFSEARRLTVLGDAIADEGQDGGTAGSQSCHRVHLYSFGFCLARTCRSCRVKRGCDLVRPEQKDRSLRQLLQEAGSVKEFHE